MAYQLHTRRAAPSAAPPAAPGSAPGGAPGAPADAGPMIDLRNVTELLPFRPGNQNYESFKSRCTNFVNHWLDRSGHDTDRLMRMMPNCTWGAENCKKLQADLVARIQADSGAGGNGAAPAAPDAKVDFLQKTGKKVKSAIIPAWAQQTQGVFGWCDTVWNSAKDRAMSEMKEELVPAKRLPGVKEPMPMETNNPFRDAKNLHEWAKRSLDMDEAEKKRSKGVGALAKAKRDKAKKEAEAAKAKKA